MQKKILQTSKLTKTEGIGLDSSDSATKTTQGSGGNTVETVSTGTKKGKK
jgi:hypothetical protein